MSSDSGDERPTSARLRRAPRIGVFLVLGGVIGLIATLIVTSQFEADPSVGFVASFAYFCLFGIPAGVLVGAIVALILDAVSRRRMRTVAVESQYVEPDPAAGPEAGPDENREPPIS